MFLLDPQNKYYVISMLLEGINEICAFALRMSKKTCGVIQLSQYCGS